MVKALGIGVVNCLTVADIHSVYPYTGSFLWSSMIHSTKKVCSQSVIFHAALTMANWWVWLKYCSIVIQFFTC